MAEELSSHLSKYSAVDRVFRKKVGRGTRGVDWDFHLDLHETEQTVG